jgi:hypothetical protein
MQTEPIKLELAPEQPGEQPIKQLAPYDEFKAKIEAIRKTAETITVTDVSQTAEMKIARATRLSLKEIRVAITHRHKELKESILIEGRRIDAGKNALLEIIEPLELRLKEQEEFIERENTRIQDEKRAARTAEISPFLISAPLVDLGALNDDQYAAMLSDAKDAHTARLAREQKEREEAEARARAEAEERERIRLENERLKKEAAEREAQMRAEREKAEAEAKRVREEQARAEAAARAERERIEREHQAKLEAERKAAAEERAAAEAKAKKEREARERAEAELEAKRQSEARAEAERKVKEEAAAMAPEKEKLNMFAQTVRSLAVPTLTTEKGAKAAQEISEKVESFAKWIEKQAAAI